jgi:LPS O-antigen subunit length determinant protein (WzzB/FepE family)
MNQQMNQPAYIDDDADEISLLDLLTTVAESWRLLLVGPLLVGLCALGGSYLIPPSYTAVTKFLPPQQQQGAAASMLQSLGALGGLAGAATGLKNPGDQYVAFLKSRSVQGALNARYKLQARYEAELTDDVFDKLNSHVRISNGKDGLISIVEELGKLLDRLAVTEAQQRRQFFEKQLQQTKTKLTQAEQALKATGVTASVLKTSPAAAVASLAQLQAQITAQEIKLASMRGYLTEAAPAFKQAQAELAALRAEGDKSALSNQQAEVGGADYIARYREMKYYETLFELFARQFELAKVDESREGALIQVLDMASPPERKSKPKKAMIAVIGAIIAGVVILLFVFAREAYRRQKNDQEGAQKLAKLREALR